MRKQQFIKGLATLVLCTGFMSCSKDHLQNAAENNPKLVSGNFKKSLNSSSAYWNYASQTHNFIYGNILTSYNSYRVNTTTNTSAAYEWYNSSQIYADATFYENGGGSAYKTYMDNTFAFMNYMWDTGNQYGGYFSSTSISGSGNSGVKYVDDNSLTGVAYMEAYAATGESGYLTSAEACANWLMNCGLWDTTFGGGFWQSTQKLAKPTQSNGLAMQLFLKLYQQTGQSYYLSWANSVRTWIEGNLYDSTSGCYMWQIDANGTTETSKFTYDNAIMIEADLLYSSITSNSSYTTKAQNLGIAMNTTLWHVTSGTSGVYALSTATGNVNPCWCVWGSQAMILLYQRDGNTAWLSYAQENIDWLNTYCRNATNYGYYQYVQLDGTSPTIDYEGVDQAWMQREQVLLSNYK